MVVIKESKKVEEVPEPELWEKWNIFIEKIEEARRYWEDEVRGASRREVELNGGTRTKILHLYRREKFEILTPRLIEYYRGYGGLEAMKAKGKGE